MIDENVWRNAAKRAWEAMNDVAYGADRFNENVRKSMSELKMLIDSSSTPEIIRIDKKLPPHEFVSEQISPWVPSRVNRCVDCGCTFRSEHSARFHTCEL